MSRRDKKLLTFNSVMLRNKRDVLEVVDEFCEKAALEKGEPRRGNNSKALLELANEFRKKLQKSNIPDLTKPLLFYEFYVTNEMLVLTVNRCEDIEFDDESEPESLAYSELYSLVKIQSPYVSVAQFAELHDVAVTTVRQWIRRGKLRSAKKNGRDWLISSLAEKPHRGYESGSYDWDELPQNIRDAYPFLEDSKGVFIFQERSESDVFCAIPQQGSCESIRMTAKEREKLELMLIAAPETSFSDFLYTVNTRLVKPESAIPFLSKQRVKHTSEEFSGLLIRERNRNSGLVWYNNDGGDMFLQEERSPYLVPFIWDLRAVYAEKEDDVFYELDEGGSDDATVNIGSVHGYFIMCEKLISEGYDPWLECDNQSGDLEYLISTLTKKDGPLNEDTGDPYSNLFYIHSLKIEEKYRRQGFGSRVLREIPYLCRKFYYTVPDIITYILDTSEREAKNDAAEDASRKAALRSFYESNGFQKIDHDNLVIAYVDIWGDED
ncbi:MAG: helix-turn-helix domain-containing protein [Coriobacteriales bacterium]|jgi:GNAT superfamily N-acetyltransferase|nr:helix-turn-helix domain-containing protein [Coriobacteriales bacterium]